ncbi:2-oxo acid dehydrogenase subunit E2 [Croceibacterium sp. LX-88]|uniref:Dihydrolipoamide acetyltransferase component of pyruvate dehydrogenase complex n=1 Tax=Croceibacterium selenioxidans TaxID=2838833 RepID=A0ABS5W1D6_9SPHN|nr:dihydrolipoamide acetyltransferase family protein [Croceibacterium selenioxidans]MBT2133580.1 2-oxo acid dehydrogenase subunit E2 [Croceibacterium selenioxidans]
MGRFTFKLPDIGEGIAEAEIVAWYVKVGDRVEEDGRLADLMTDKATVEMESPRAGVVLEVAGEVGDVIAIGSPLVVLEVDGEIEERPSTSSGQAEVGEKVTDVRPAPQAAPQTPPQPPAAPPEPVRPEPAVAPRPSPPPVARAPKAAAKVLASPAVRARAKELGIELSDVRPAEGERIRHADLDAFISYGGASGYAPAGVTGQDQVIKVVGLRRRIAENMAASKRNIPHFTYVEECDVTELEKLRADLNANRGARPKLTLLPLLIVAVCRALPKFPMLNARYDDEAGVVTRYGTVHMGMAAMTEAGLMVPVLRDAQTLNLWQLAAEIVRLAEAARDGKAKSEELSGSTFTLTSLGPLGGIASTPVINRPEVAILAPNRIVERPMFVPDGMGGERVEKRKLMNLSISCDHRVVDGYDAAAFVQEVKRLIETPVLLLAN